MLHAAPTSETKTDTTQGKTPVVPQFERELHPRSHGSAGLYSPGGISGAASGASPNAQRHQTLAGMHSTYGNQAVLRTLHTSPQVARMTPLRPSQGIMLQRKCACGGSPESEGECAECKAKREGTLQRSVGHQGAITAVPPIVHNVLSSPGQPLDAGTRAFMEPRFGHKFSQVQLRVAPTTQTRLTVNQPGDIYEQEADRVAQKVLQSSEPGATTVAGYDFSNVRVYTDAKAAESAQAVNARAYTVGNHIAFAKGQYAPRTLAGRSLLAHELAHVVQQSGEGGGLIQRDLAVPGGETHTAAATTATPPTDAPKQSGELEGDTAQSTSAAVGRVKRIVIAIADGLIVIETASMSYLYELESLNIPEGNYTAGVTVKGKTVCFDFGEAISGPSRQVFHFNYHINQGQENPATLLEGQSSVTVDVVSQIDIDPETTAQPLSCLLPLNNRTVIEQKDLLKPPLQLFKPIAKKVEWDFATIPLGFLGWIDANASAGISVAGLLSGGYGPGKLTEICLFRKLDRDRLAGSARFQLGAAISPSIELKGKLLISADYNGIFSVASIGGDLVANAIGMLSGAIDGKIDVIYNRRTGKWVFAAEALLSGAAGMKFKVTASAVIKLIGFEVWSEKWNLVDHDFHIGWQGGLRIGTDTKPRFDFGSIGTLAQGPDQKLIPTLATASAPDPLVEAKIDADNITQTLLSKQGGVQHHRRGLSKDDALPLVWYKPLEIYPQVLHIPRAISPEKLERLAGPTPVTYRYSRTNATEEIGVKDTLWPHVGMFIQYLPLGEGDDEKDRLRDLFSDKLLPSGESLRGMGFDVDHVIEKQIGGRDKFYNLWPADYQEQQLAGGLLEKDLKHYRDTLMDEEGSLAGRWFEIVEFRRASTVK